MSTPTQAGGNGTASFALVSNEQLLEPLRSERSKGLSLKRRGLEYEDATEHQKEYQLDQNSNVLIQPPGRLQFDSASGVVNHVVGVSADEGEPSTKRQRRDGHLPQVFDVAKHIAVDKSGVQDNHDVASNPGGHNPWLTLQKADASTCNVEQLKTQNIDVEGRTAIYSLENLQKERYNVDKAIEAAQVKRRQCEVQERKLRRAYREALFALSSANARCRELSHLGEYLSVQVQSAESHILRQPSFSILTNRNIPDFHSDKSIIPRITELPCSTYPSIICGAKPPIESEVGLYVVSTEEEAQIQSSATVDRQTFKLSSSSADGGEVFRASRSKIQKPSTTGMLKSQYEVRFC